MKRIIAPSILSADYAQLGDEIRAVEAAGADWIHCDVMDGHFVPAMTIGPPIIEAASRVTNLPLDVHLMMENPDTFIPEFVKAGANYITVHQEVCPHLNRTLQLIRTNGAKAGVALNPSTSLITIDEVLEYIDMVLIMTVNPGFGGQEFIESGLAKIARLRQIIDEQKRNVLIEVDGGVKIQNAARLSEAGVDVFVAGSSIFGTDDYKKTIAAFRKAIE